MKLNLRLTYIVVGLIAFLACTEVPPFIDYSEPILLAKDTTYVTNDLPQPQSKKVVIEDVSGVQCVNCPEAAKIAHDIKDDHPENVIVLTLHSKKYAVYTAPIKDTFNTQEATDIIDNLISPPQGLPTGAVDRKVFPGKTDPLLPMTSWQTAVEAQLQETSVANLELEVIPESGSRKVVINVKSTFLEPQNTNIHLSLFISESHIISPQKSLSGKIEDYEHNFILRKGITSYSGLLLSDNIVTGTVFEKGFEIEIPTKYDIENCSIVALINRVNKDNNEILQAAEVEL